MAKGRYTNSGVATGVQGCGRHRAALAKGGKGAKNAENFLKIHVKIQIVSFICVCVQENKALRPACTYRQLLRWVLGCVRFERETYALNKLSSFENLRQILAPPWAAKGPATPLYINFLNNNNNDNNMLLSQVSM